VTPRRQGSNQLIHYLQLLLEKGSDIEVKGAQGKTALHAAADSGQKDIANMLIKHFIATNPTGNDSHLFVDAERAHLFQNVSKIKIESS
jgi:ankyrin repeat protein